MKKTNFKVNPLSLDLKPSLSIKKGSESPGNKKTITFVSDYEEKSSGSLQKSKKKKKKPTHSELMAQVSSKYLVSSTISTLAKLEIEKRFKPDDAEKEKRFFIFFVVSYIYLFKNFSHI